jgi:alpha-mannosidase
VQDWGGFIGQWDTREWNPRPDKVTMRDFRAGPNAPTHEVPLRKDWAVSANHAVWDLTDRGSPAWSPRYPEDYKGLAPGYIKRADVGWYATHHHTPDGLNEPYSYSYLFVYPIDVPAGARTLTLPDDSDIRILAISAAREQPRVRAIQPLYDTLGRQEPVSAPDVSTAPAPNSHSN